MKREVKIDFDGKYYLVYAKHKGGMFRFMDYWEYKSLFDNLEDAKKAAEEMRKFPEYLP